GGPRRDDDPATPDPDDREAPTEPTPAADPAGAGAADLADPPMERIPPADPATEHLPPVPGGTSSAAWSQYPAGPGPTPHPYPTGDVPPPGDVPPDDGDPWVDGDGGGPTPWMISAVLLAIALVAALVV